MRWRLDDDGWLESESDIITKAHIERGHRAAVRAGLPGIYADRWILGRVALATMPRNCVRHRDREIKT